MNLLSTLMVDGTEYFSVMERKHAVNVNGIVELDALPEDFAALLAKQLATDKKANKSLDRRRIKSTSARIDKYFECNYSRFGGNADVKTSGALGEREVINCPNRLTCPDQGKLCKIPCGLTKQEAIVSIHISLGKMDAEICHFLKISQNTLRSYKNNIEFKIKQPGKIAIGVWAYAVGLVHIKE
jgi:DNA-binding NarL/FixJ family response regulator